MIFFEKNKNLFENSVDAIINTVNCVGIMGKGLALQFKQKYPENYKAYKKACDNKEIQTGKMFVFDNGFISKPNYIINFPTKNHWKENSKISYIKDGLEDLKQVIAKLKIKSIAIPPLGCGNGGLNWQEVRNLIIASLGNVEIDIYIYEPTNKFTEVQTKEKPTLTDFRALFLKTVQLYNDALYELSNIEIQKLVYFINLISKNNKLKYTKASYGPYCSNLHNAIDNLANTYITGVSDGTSQNHIKLIDNVINEVDLYINNSAEPLAKYIESIANVITGYETPYGMELLGTVHWVIAEEKAQNIDETIKLVHAWNDRKKEIMSVNDITLAYNHLKNCNLIS